MKVNEGYAEYLNPRTGYSLAKAIQDNIGWLTIAEQRVGGDVEAACALVGRPSEDCQAPQTDPAETRMAAYMLLLEDQQRRFGKTRPTLEDDNLEGYTLANVTSGGLMLMRRRKVGEKTTLLEATKGTDMRVKVTKTIYDYYHNEDPVRRPITQEDRLVMEDTRRRLQQVNLKWHELLKNHYGPVHLNEIPLPRTASRYS